MATPNKLDNPYKVAEALKANKGRKNATARALGVTRQALYEYIPKHIDIECIYTVKTANRTIDTRANQEE